MKLVTIFLEASEAKINAIAKKLDSKLQMAAASDNTIDGDVTSQQLVGRMAEFSEIQNGGAKVEFLDTLAVWYSKGQFKIGELEQVSQVLQRFVRVRRQLQEKDINRYASPTELAAAIKDVEEVESNKQKERNAIDALFKDRKAELLWKEGQFKIVYLRSEEAAVQLGKGTKWCTSATCADNMYSRYDADGEIYILYTPKGRYQLHIQTEQFMDESDSPVKIDDFLKQYEIFVQPLIEVYLHTDIAFGDIPSSIIKDELSSNDFARDITELAEAAQYSYENYRVLTMAFEHNAFTGQKAIDIFAKVLLIIFSPFSIQDQTGFGFIPGMTDSEDSFITRLKSDWKSVFKIIESGNVDLSNVYQALAISVRKIDHLFSNMSKEDAEYFTSTLEDALHAINGFAKALSEYDAKFNTLIGTIEDML